MTDANDRIKASKKAGQINRTAIEYGFSVAKPGVRLKKLDYLVGSYIKDHGGEPAFLGYQGFPMNACISINDEIVHGIADNRMLKEGDILTIDVGTKIDGWNTDAAETRIIGSPKNPEHIMLVQGAKAILKAGLAEIKDGNSLFRVAKACEMEAEKHKLDIYPHLCGHQIGREIHEGFHIFHTTKTLDNATLLKLKSTVVKSEMLLCIEPIVSLGSVDYTVKKDGWTLKNKNGDYSAHEERMVLVTDNGYEVIS